MFTGVVRNVEDDRLIVILFDRGHQARAAHTNLLRRRLS
jgi:hypothetical protein